MKNPVPIASNELRVDVRSLPDSDVRELTAVFCPDDDIAEVRYYMYIMEAAHAPSKILEFILLHRSDIIVNVGSGFAITAVLTLKHKIQEWYRRTKECKHRNICIYGPDGQIVRIIECEVKPHANRV